MAFGHSVSWARCISRHASRRARPRWGARSFSCRAAETSGHVYHTPVLPAEVLAIFEKAERLETFVDGTVGAGGHAELLLEKLPSIRKLIGIDRDRSALEITGRRLSRYLDTDRLVLVHGNFADVDSLIEQAGVGKGEVDGMLLDVGVSSMQIDNGDRGFSFQNDGDLDMRMDRSSSMSAFDVVNSWSEEELGRIIREFGEEPRWRRIAGAIVQNRRTPISSTHQLADLIVGAIGWPKRIRGQKGIHPATKTFQAIRIVVNEELTHLADALPRACKVLRPSSGRLAVISFHSLEDRMVKTFIREESRRVGGLKTLTKKVIQAADAEANVNVRSRSAKLRAAQRLGEDEQPIFGRRNKYPKGPLQ
mmetsp:Transcript_53025/g.130017  ORF Transcript_53025/g.130017 Transcript_53025/m.130017 type:complete len:364 (+) Transcript_53025:272-1363(+)